LQKHAPIKFPEKAGFLPTVWKTATLRLGCFTLGDRLPTPKGSRFKAITPMKGGTRSALGGKKGSPLRRLQQRQSRDHKDQKKETPFGRKLDLMAKQWCACILMVKAGILRGNVKSLGENIVQILGLAIFRADSH
jgi:hypothetical protein